MKRAARLAAIGVLAAVFIVSLTVVIHRLAEYRAGGQTYAAAQELARVPAESSAVGPAPVGEEETDPYEAALAELDLPALQAVNGDALGWIMIPETEISYPLVQGTDNQYYLTHTWDNAPSAVGAVFLDWRASPDLSDFHTLIYGHRMKNGSMFAGLKYFSDRDYWQEHPYVYITDGSGTKRYEIFSAYEADVRGETYRVGQQSREEKQAYLDFCLAQSQYDTGVVPTADDTVVTLSTCTGSGHATRWVVQARLEGGLPAESAEPDGTAETSSNAAA